MDVSESLQSFYTANLITSGIRKRLNISPVTATILLYLLFNTILLIAAIHDNIIFTTGNRLGFLNDFAWWLTITLGFNVIFYTFLWLPGGIVEIISKLVQNKTIRLPSLPRDEKETLDIYIQKFVRSFSNPLWYIISAAIAIPYTLIFFVPDQQKRANYKRVQLLVRNFFLDPLYLFGVDSCLPSRCCYSLV